MITPQQKAAWSHAIPLEAEYARPGRDHLPPTGNRVELEFIDIFRIRDGRLIEHWTSMDIAALRQQMRP